ncbi:MAG: transglycosylase SLT domain-containing protein [Solirubrobacterales bacterium]
MVFVLAATAVGGGTLVGCGGASASSPQRVTDQLAQTDRALRSTIDDWRAGGDPPEVAPPQEVLDQAEALQDDALYLARHPNLTAQVLPLLSPALARQIRRLTTAEKDLLSLSRGARHRHLKVGAPPPLSDLIGFYREANQRYGVAWNYLAAIHLVETKFGRVKSNSVAGAKGPMQFIPSTWRIYGDGGDIRDPHDAILAAANLLHHNGAPPQYARALRAYNDSGLYVDAVTRYAREIAANPYGIYYLYCWRP